MQQHNDFGGWETTQNIYIFSSFEFHCGDVAQKKRKSDLEKFVRVVGGLEEDPIIQKGGDRFGCNLPRSIFNW